MLPLAGPRPVRAGPEQPGFVDTAVLTGLTQPTAVEFASDGRVFVAEKSGIIRVFSSLSASSSSVFADLRTQVHNYWDRGLLGMALHPNFPTDNRVYVLYAHDAVPGGTAPRWGDQCPSPPGGTGDGCLITGRLSVLSASGNVSTGETVLITDWCQQFPSHSIGDLAFGPDGALYVSGGDGASFNYADYGQSGGSSGSPVPKNPCGDPPSGVGGTQTVPTAEGGALRSQDLRTSGDPTSLDGAILRLDPNTGAAMAGNPLIGSTDPNARRIVAYGLRNPFRITVRPGTNEVWAGDVGWSSWEEINRVVNPQAGPTNFGWPCYEGPTSRPGTYRDLNICLGLYGQSGAHQAGHFSYAHGQQVANETCSTGSGSSISGLAFYTGGTYPSQYNGALFFADYSRRCIWVMYAGQNGLPDPTTRTTFISAAASPVQLKIGPGGDLFYVDLGGSIHRVRYTSANQSPVASIVAQPTSGPAPLQVSFDASGSFDPDGNPMTYSWDLNGDGVYGDSTAVTAQQTYSAGVYTVRLRVTDSLGATGFASVTIEAGGSGASRYISDLPFTLETNGWGPVERDRSNGEQGGTDGGTITLNGLTYPKGLGVHALSDVRITVPADCTRFISSIGLDDEVGSNGSVQFEVYADAALLFQSSVMTGASATQSVDVAVSAGQTLRLVVVGGTAIDYDHADWAGARLLCDASNTPPTARIDLPEAGTTWRVGDSFFFTGRGLDTEQGLLPASALSWSLILHHCAIGGGCHEHPIQSWTGVSSGSFVAPDHDYPSHLELRLTATDGGGLSHTASLQLDPQTTDLNLVTSPPGLQLTVGSQAPTAAPFTHEAIVGSVTSIGAPAQQTLGGVTYAFVGWSDGGASTHQITVGSSPTTYTATYEPTGVATTRYISDLAFTVAANGWGPVERDRSNGEQGPTDGAPLTLNGVVYAKGLGVHALSDLSLTVPAGCTRFVSSIGVDDEVGANGSVQFEVYANTTRVFQSAVITGSSATQSVDLPMTAGQALRLVVIGGASIAYDHGDWADARLLCDESEPPANQAPSLTQPANQTHTEGAAVSLQLSASDPDNDPLTYSATGLPGGLSINASSGLISGTLAAGSSAASPYSVTATVNDGRGGSASRTFSWTVNAPAPPSAPTGLTALATTVDTELTWNAVSGASGYNVYRAAASSGPYVKLNGALLTATAYVDSTASATTSSWYQVVAVNAIGTESAPASVVAHRRIQLVNTTTGANNATSSLQLSVPAGRAVDDLLLATITINGAQSITPPTGWTLVRVDTSGSTLRQAIYYRLATSSEPASYTWSFSGSTGAAGIIAAYRGVSTTSPIDAHSGRVNPSSTQVPTNAITTITNHSAVVALYGMAWNTTLNLPAALDERAEASMQRSRSRVALALGDRVAAVPGSTGTLTATSGKSSVSIGQLLALRPAGP